MPLWPRPTPPAFAYLDHPRPLAYAHRGGAGEAEENTAAAFAHAAALGFTYVETDIQATRDGVAVLFHDETLDRLTGEEGTIAQFTWDELRRLRTRDGQRLMRLDELLAGWPRFRVTVEMKTDDSVEPLAETLRRCGAVSRVCAASFRTSRVTQLRRLLGPELCWSPGHLGVLHLRVSRWPLAWASPRFPLVQVPVRHKGMAVVTPALLRAARVHGVQVHVWTVNAREEMERLLDMGVDGLMTDYPTLLREVLEERGSWRLARENETETR